MARTQLRRREPGTYTVTAQDGVTTKSYRVAIGLLPYNPVQITNGSFEIGKAMDQGSGAYAQVSLPGTGLARVVRQLHPVVYLSLGESQPRTDACLNLVYGTGTDALSQSFPVTAGITYTVRYYELKRGGGGYMDTTLSVAAGTVTGAAGRRWWFPPARPPASFRRPL